LAVSRIGARFVSQIETTVTPAANYRHEALLYSGGADFLDRTEPFIRGAVENDEPILVAVSRVKIDGLRALIGAMEDKVRFNDMAEVGSNPVRIIPVWREFVEEHAESGVRMRGIGEPIWAERSPEELVECERHEALLNLAIADAAPLWLLCPYDVDSLNESVVREAERNHPYVERRGEHQVSAAFRGLEDIAAPFDEPLSPAPASADRRSFSSARDLADLRRFVASSASRFGLGDKRVTELVLSADEVATNSLKHGGGSGTLKVWKDHLAVICEVRDGGRLDAPLAGRVKPKGEAGSGFGLWLAGQLCDLVQVRAFRDHSVVRLHRSLPVNASAVGAAVP
jgi:anti-sigma regulatory factor (Ser/Thr protein kinase)